MRKISKSLLIAIGCISLSIGIFKWRSKFSLFYPSKAIISDQAVAKKELFASVLISKWTRGGCPCMPIQIGDKTLPALIDLGFRGYFSVDSSTLHQIADKILVGSRVTYGFQGAEFKKNVFNVPQIRVGIYVFDHAVVEEVGPEFYEQTAFTNDGSPLSPAQPGTIGWKVFQQTNLLLDLKNKQIAFCDSLSTLKKQGYDTQKLIQTELMTDRGLVEINAEINGQTLRCMLDTGCSFNVLNTENEQNKTMQELMWNPENFPTVHSFKINQKEFGSIAFRHIPIRLPIHIDAVLGMDFFSENIVFLDFANNLAYFSN